MNSLPTISDIFNYKAPKTHTLAALQKTDFSIVNLILSTSTLHSNICLNPYDNSLSININDTPLLKFIDNKIYTLGDNNINKILINTSMTILGECSVNSIQVVNTATFMSNVTFNNDIICKKLQTSFINTPYNQNLNINAGPTMVFTNFAGAVAPTINYRTYFNNYKQFVQGANQGAGWTGFGPGWYTPASLGAASFYITSTRDTKTNIQSYAPSAVDLLKQVDIVSYNLEIEQCDEDKRIGFIAENTPKELSTDSKNQMEISCTLAFVLKAIQEIDARIVNLQNKKNNAS